MLSLVRVRLLLAILAVLTPAAAAQVAPDERQLRIDERYPHVRVIECPRGGVVNQALFVALRQHIETAAAEGRKMALVIDVDSGGGEVAAAQEITDFIRAFRRHEDLRIFAFVGPDREAISAAAWIALSCRGLLIAPSAVIGDIQPLVFTMRGYENVPEKVVTKLAEDVWIDARDNGLEQGYPELFVRAMVDKDIEILAVRNERLGGEEEFVRADELGRWSAERRSGLTQRSVSSPGRAFTTNGSDLLRFGFPVLLVSDRDAILDAIGTPNASWEVITIEDRSVFDFGLLGYVDWSWLLLLLAVVLLVMELQAPGLGVFGVLSVMALIGFFLAQFGFEDRAFLASVLLLVGAFLIVVEAVLLPGLLLPGLAGLVLVLYATWIGIARPADPSFVPWPDFGDEEGRRGLAVWAGTLLGIVAVVFTSSTLLGKVLHRVPFLGKLIIVPPPAVGAEAQAAATASTGSWQGHPPVGARGRALTDLRPSGIASIDGRKVDVVGRGPWIAAGRAVLVCEVAGNRVVVRELRETSTQEAMPT